VRESQETGQTSAKPEELSGPDLVAALEELVHERFPEGLVKTLEHRYGRHGTAADDAVGDALEKMVRKAEKIKARDPKAYLTTVASHAMAKALARARF
jgi:DNA-directed RNA polymerase specialized sigma24 family protein